MSTQASQSEADLHFFQFHQFTDWQKPGASVVISHEGILVASFLFLGHEGGCFKNVCKITEACLLKTAAEAAERQ